MCSIFKFKNCIGRNFDYQISYGEELKNIPKNKYDNKYAVIGICTGAVEEYPLMYDGMNEYGLVCGGLAFQGNAHYYTSNEIQNKPKIPSYKFTFHILSNFKTVSETRKWLEKIYITNEEYPSTDLHWFIADEKESIIIEQTIEGLNIYDAEVMTNNPPYNEQLEYYDAWKGMIGSCEDEWDKEWLSRGRETDGLDGGYSSNERFARLSYLKTELEKSDTSNSNINETFHLLSSVEQIYGVTKVQDKYEYTIYSVIYDTENKRVWIKTYDKICPTNHKLTLSYEKISLS